ncbi:uncharacterized protein LOC111470562 [Cucurbita maxima]|uniref:Uncharacterized protein LOC111470562 n=1 Tax=Cucurbita maxima TaxID=3661 RepID=A0A6J1I9S9_CUCMA|nr:uncharacterized protein LOC111470562 [Cucurbita maxima]
MRVLEKRQLQKWVCLAYKHTNENSLDAPLFQLLLSSSIQLESFLFIVKKHEQIVIKQRESHKLHIFFLNTFFFSSFKLVLIRRYERSQICLSVPTSSRRVLSRTARDGTAAIRCTATEKTTGVLRRMPCSSVLLLPP